MTLMKTFLLAALGCAASVGPPALPRGPAPAFDEPPRFMPLCRGGERGYWQPLVQTSPAGDLVVYLALTRVNDLTPDTVICWLRGAQSIQALPPEPRPRDLPS